jgi:hypothetical protein
LNDLFRPFLPSGRTGIEAQCFGLPCLADFDSIWQFLPTGGKSPTKSELKKTRIFYRNDSPWINAWLLSLASATGVPSDKIRATLEKYAKGLSSYDELAKALETTECKDRCLAFGLRSVDAEPLKLLKINGLLPGKSQYPLGLETTVFVKHGDQAARKILEQLMERNKEGALHDFSTLKREIARQ